MQYSKSGLALTEGFEGCKLTAYPDPGTGGAPYTIGFGHTKGVKPGDTCTLAQAELWLLLDLHDAIEAVNRLVTVPLDQNEFDALVDFVFNLGEGNLAKSSLLRKLNAGDDLGAAREFEKWDMAAGKHMAGLLRRRRAEKDLFLGGRKA